jgi:hypothetical protein
MVLDNQFNASERNAEHSQHNSGPNVGNLIDLYTDILCVIEAAQIHFFKNALTYWVAIRASSLSAWMRSLRIFAARQCYPSSCLSNNEPAHPTDSENGSTDRFEMDIRVYLRASFDRDLFFLVHPAAIPGVTVA